MHKLKKKLAKSTDLKEKKYLTEKIRKISFYPIKDGPEE
jgi:hypothetical protein